MEDDAFPITTEPCGNECPHVGDPTGVWQDEGDSIHCHWDDILTVGGITAYALTDTNWMVVILGGEMGNEEHTHRSIALSAEGMVHTISLLIDTAKANGWDWALDQIKAHLAATT